MLLNTKSEFFQFLIHIFMTINFFFVLLNFYHPVKNTNADFWDKKKLIVLMLFSKIFQDVSNFL